MFTAAVLAKKSGTSVFTVRHYARIGLLRPSRDLANGYKMYRQADVQRLRFVSAAKELGFSLAEIEDILGHADAGESPCPDVRQIVERRIEENQRKIDELIRLQNRLEKARIAWKRMKNSEPDGHSVCRLIESFSEADA